MSSYRRLRTTFRWHRPCTTCLSSMAGQRMRRSPSMTALKNYSIISGSIPSKHHRGVMLRLMRCT